MNIQIVPEFRVTYALHILLLALLLLSPHGQSAVLVQLESKEGALAYKSRGTWDDSNAELQIHSEPLVSGGIELTITPIEEPVLQWSLHLAGPGGSFPGPGAYTVERYPFHDGDAAGVDINADGLGCNRGQGSVEVHDIEYSPNGDISRIAADISYACTNATQYAVAKLRIDSEVPLDLPSSHAVVVSEQTVSPGQTVVLDGSLSYADNDSITRFLWEQLEGEPVELANPNAATTSFTFPESIDEYHQMLFRLTVSDSQNRQDTALTDVLSDAARQPDVISILERGNNFVWTRRVSGLRSPPNPIDYSRTWRGGINVPQPNIRLPLITITAPEGGDLRIGGYSEAQADFFIPLFPGFVYSGCNNTPTDDTQYETYFDVLDLAFFENGSVDRLGFDFYTRCAFGNRNTYEGSVRVNSYAPRVSASPRALAGVDKSFYAGEPEFLNGILSRATSSSIMSYQWRQVSGPSVTIRDANSAIAQIVAPNTISETDVASFMLTVTDRDGRQSSDVVNMTIVPISAPRTYMYFESDVDTFVGGGKTAYLRDMQDTSLGTIIGLQGMGPETRDTFSIFDDNARSWSFSLLSPASRQLRIGDVFETAGFDEQDLAAELIVDNTGRGCNISAGVVRVLDVEHDANSRIASLALDFEKMCQFDSGSIRGSIRYNSTTPNSYEIFSADAGPDLIVTEGQTVELVDRSGSYVSSRWVQIFGPELKLSDPASKRTTIVPPTIPAGESRHFGFRLLNQRNDGAFGEDFIVIRVDDNERTGWDEVNFEKYIDKPHAYQRSNGEAFGFRTVEPLENPVSLSFEMESVLGLQVGDLEVVSELFPVTEISMPSSGGSTRIEFFSRESISDEYSLIVQGADDMWRISESLSTGDGLYQEAEWSRLHITIQSQDSRGVDNDRDNAAHSKALKFAVVSLGSPTAEEPESVPPPVSSTSGDGEGGGGIVSWLDLLIILLARWFWTSGVLVRNAEI